jgi:hypothetical protein
VQLLATPLQCQFFLLTFQEISLAEICHPWYIFMPDIESILGASPPDPQGLNAAAGDIGATTRIPAS